VRDVARERNVASAEDQEAVGRQARGVGQAVTQRHLCRRVGVGQAQVEQIGANRDVQIE
jgi:hypothetical protein